MNGGSSVVTGVSLGTSALPIIGAVGEFPNSIEKYVGVKFDASGNTHYGWVKISLNTNCDTLILHGMGYQRTASTGGYTSIEESISFEKNISFSQSQDEISIYNSNSNKLNLTITSLNGEQVVNSSLNSTIKLNTSNFSKGIYVLTLSDGKNVYSKKFYLNN